MMNYTNFDLETFEHKPSSAGDQFRVRVASGPVGEQSLAEAERVRLPVGVRNSITALRQRKLSFPEIITLGEKLGEALFPPRVRSFFSASLNRLGDEQCLRIRLKPDTYGLAGLPWEYVYLPLPNVPSERRGPEGFLALNHRVSLVRYESQEGPLVPIDAGVRPLRLVVLLASPNDPNFDKLDVAKERQNIEQALTGLSAIYSDFYPDATTETLQDALLNPAHIFHFAGHGQFTGDMGECYGSQEGIGAVILLDDQGGAKPFSAQKLAMSLTARSVRLAVLTACEGGERDATNPWAGVVTALTHAGIPAVVGMQFSIRDTNGLAFSRAFYRALAAGLPIDAAATEGRFAIFNRGDDNERDWGVPVLYLRAIDGVLFPQAEAKPAAESPHQGTPGTTPTQPGPGPGPTTVDKRTLREAMVKAFSNDDLEVLCVNIETSLKDAGHDLQVNLDVVGGVGKEIRVLNLIDYLDRRGYLGYLVNAVRERKPDLI